jgi:serine/threonine-protein kinase
MMERIRNSPATVFPSVAVRRWLSILALATAALAVYQWAELIAVRMGQQAMCSLSETFNCEAVWNLPAAQAFQRWLGIPVAALGFIWGISAYVLVKVVSNRAKPKLAAAPLAALKIWSWLGLAGVVVFGGLSLKAGTVCIVCIGTYVLVGAFFALLQWRVPVARTSFSENVKDISKWVLLPLASAFAFCWVMARLLPDAPETPLAVLRAFAPTAKAEHDPSRELERFIEQLSAKDAQTLSNALEVYRRAPPGTVKSPRALWGPQDAKVRMVEFTDIRCIHCKTLVEEMQQVKTMVPPQSLSVEARNFPLDAECNALMTASDGTQVRCAATKALICLEPRPEFWKIREQIFANQAELNLEKVWDIVTSGSMSKAELQSCMDSPETAEKLKSDVTYAEEYKLQGTPMVIVNGKRAPALASFLYAIVLAEGRADSPAFSKLPAPQAGIPR